MNDQEITQQFLSQFPRQIDGLVYLFLRSIAHERMVHSSGYALSRQLGIYRTTLFRILYRLEQQRMNCWETKQNRSGTCPGNSMTTTR